MLGLGLAALYLFFLWLTGTVFEAGYYHATRFLFLWYCYWAAFNLIFVISLVGIIGLISASARERIRKISGKAAAFLTITALSVSALFLFHRFCFAAGAYFLHSALIIQGEFYTYSWNPYKLALGIGLWLFSWTASKRKN